MGQRFLAHVQFDVSYLYPDHQTFEDFAHAVMVKMQAAVDMTEMEFHTRGIEVIKDNSGVVEHDYGD